MATKSFDRMVINPLERPLSSDINQLQSNVQKTRMMMIEPYLRHKTFVPELSAPDLGFSDPLAAGGPFAAFIGDSFMVRPRPEVVVSSTGYVDLTAGIGYVYNPADTPSSIGGLTGVDDLSLVKPLQMDFTETITIPAPDATNPRIDLIELKVDRRLEQTTARDFLNVSTGDINPQSVPKVLACYLNGRVGFVAYNQDSTTGIGYKTGQPAGSPAAPATTSGYVPIANLRVNPGATTVGRELMTDRRIIARPYGMLTINGFLSWTHDGTNVTAIAGDFQAPPGVRVALVHETGKPFAPATPLTVVVLLNELGEATPGVQSFITTFSYSPTGWASSTVDMQRSQYPGAVAATRLTAMNRGPVGGGNPAGNPCSSPQVKTLAGNGYTWLSPFLNPAAGSYLAYVCMHIG